MVCFLLNTCICCESKHAWRVYICSYFFASRIVYNVGPIYCYSLLYVWLACLLSVYLAFACASKLFALLCCTVCVCICDVCWRVSVCNPACIYMQLCICTGVHYVCVCVYTCTCLCICTYGVFDGFIKTAGETYYIEPSSRYDHITCI